MLMIYIPYGLTNSIPIIYTSEVLVHRETYTGILIVIIFVIASQIPSNSRITSVQFSRSVVSDSLQPHGCLPVHNQLPEFTQTHIHWVSDAIQPSHPLSSLPSIFPSIRVFSNVLAFHISWPKYWSFSFNISPSNEYSGLISFRTDWFDLLAVQGTLKNLLQHHNLKASILQLSAYFVIQLSYSYMTTGVNSPVEWKGIPLI